MNHKIYEAAVGESLNCALYERKNKMKRISKDRKVEELKQEKYMKTVEVEEEDKLRGQVECEIKGNY
jgi:hypothetical protein